MENFNNFLNDFDGNGLIAFSDPAGAKVCLAFAYILQKSNNRVTFSLYSNKKYDFYDDWDFNINIEPELENILFKSFDWAFLGTSHPDSSQYFEVKILEKINDLKCKSFSFIDHWTNFKLRFQFDNGHYIYPRTILILDKHAKQLAIKDELPENQLEILENPYLVFINKYWKSQLKKNQFKLLYSIPKHTKPIILYAPDPISIRANENKLDFDEQTVLQELLEIVKFQKNTFLIIKIHPLQNLFAINQLLSDYQLNNVILEKNKLNNIEIMFHSDIVIGFYSNFLLEANALGKKVIRYFPKDYDKDPMKHLKFGKKIYTLDFIKNAP